MTGPTARVRSVLGVSTLAVAMVAGGALVSTASYATFSAASTSRSNSWSTGSVSLGLDDSGTALFSVTGLKPGSSGTNCIAVTSTGSVPSAVRLYGTNATTTNGLSSYITVTVSMGTGGGYGSCSAFTPDGTDPTVFPTGTLASFATTATSYSSGLGVWNPTGSAPETRTYRIDYAVSGNIPNSAAGGSATIGFTWEAQNR